jgi:betaine-aldehyde dehydrogenase
MKHREGVSLMSITADLFIGGGWVGSSSRQWRDVICPITEEVLGRAAVPTFREVNQAVALARNAFDNGPWPLMTLDERVGRLRAAVKIFEDHYLDEAVSLQTDETGSPESFTRATTTSMSRLLEQLIDDAREVVPDEIRNGAAGRFKVLREPFGLIAAIVPWYAPVMAAAAKVFPALLMGCSMVLKTATESPFSAHLLAESLVKAGVPPGVFSVISGGRIIGAHLITRADVDKVVFAGPVRTGRRIAGVCGERLTPFSSDLGGKAAAILAAGADVPTHLPALLANALTNNGQLGVSTTRILVHRNQVDELRDALVGALSTMVVGDPHDPATAFGPLVSEMQRDRVEGYIASGQAQGATLAYGGTRPAHLPVGYYLTPAIFTNVTRDMAIAQDAIVGPVVCIMGYTTEIEALQIANDCDAELGGSVYADDLDHAADLAARLRSRSCSVNGARWVGGEVGQLAREPVMGLGSIRVDELLDYVRFSVIALPAANSG